MLSINNILSNFTARNLNITNTSQRKSARKLSSGFKINTAADDAAGLAISEKMRNQIAGLSKASKNSADAISFCQVADGAMSDMHEMIGRMRELCVQAANDTYVDSDRAKVQTEINEMSKEINKIIDSTDFNEIYVFKEGNRGSGAPSIGLGNILGYDQIAGVSKLNALVDFNSSAVWDTTGNPLNPTSYGSSIIDVNGVLDRTHPSGLGFPGTSGFAPSTYNMAQIAAGFSALTGLSIAGLDYATISAVTGQNTNILSYTHTNAGASVTYNFEYLTSLDGSKALSSLDISGSDGSGNNYSVKYTGSSKAGGVGIQGELDKKYGGSWIDFGNSSTGYKIDELCDEGFSSTCATCNRYYSIRFVGSSNFSSKINVDDGSGSTFEVGYSYQAGSSAYLLDIDISNCTDGDDVVSAIIAAVNKSTGFNNHFTQYAKDTADPSKLFIYDNRTGYSTTGGNSTFEYFARGPDGKPLFKQEPQNLWIQSSSNEDGMWLSKPLLGVTVLDSDANASIVNILGTERVSVTNRENAESSIGICDYAESVLSEKRTLMGSYQNRLEHSIKVVDIAAENLQAAESRIRDTDMAKEMIENTKSQILTLAGISMMAQANTALGRVSQLLQ